MCGIAGIFDAQHPPRPCDLAPMLSMQVHRGPDASGQYLEGPAAIGMRRLSIIDVAGGDQPIFNEDGSIAIVFNGEIYNYLELRSDLIGRGHQFATRSDTEVLVHLYEEFGRRMLPLLNGMFSFLIWDAPRRSLFLARDRMGIKPLYYAQQGSRWLFASELKCLRPQLARKTDDNLDLDGIADFLRLGYIPRDASPYRDVRKLLPGHSLLVNAEGAQLERWWDLAEWNQHNESRQDRAQELKELFVDAVRLRMRSDVPVASFLSGGLDSSLVTIVAQDQAPQPIHSFSLGFEHTEFDELPFARTVAQQARTSHIERVASSQLALDHLPRLLWHMDEPMGDSSIIPNFLISQMAAKRVKVCLSGLGGDELFGGYARYLDPGSGRIRNLFGPAPTLAAMLAPLVDRWSFGHAEELRMAADPSLAWRSYLKRLQIFNSQTLRALGFPAQGHAESTIEQLWRHYPGKDSVSRRQFVDQQTYLPDEILALTDRMSMANSLEVRVPFLDYRLVRLSQALSSAQKQTRTDFKIFLKQALGHLCPPEILMRPKWGFDTPLSRWVSSPALFEHVRRLDSGVCVQAGWLRPEAVRRWTSSPELARRAPRNVWNLLVLEVWMRIRGRESAPTESLDELLQEAPCAVL